MPFYSSESLERLKSRVDLVRVIEPYVDLKRAGSTYKGLCPFHQEKNPSFTVHPSDHHYHCFGCRAHGDAIRFVMDYHGKSFQEALEVLADMFSCTLDVVERGEDQKEKQQIYRVLEEAKELYHAYLLQDRQALAYLAHRGIDETFVTTFGLGLSPKNPRFVCDILQKEGFSLSVLENAGLIKPASYGGMRDFFSERILFPIHNSVGKVVGFSGRAYQEKYFGGKYINTPETLVFKKSQILYGLYESKRRIVKERVALITEGQIDALSLIYKGLDLTVASLGTAFGQEHVASLCRMGVLQVYLAFDADRAGVEAAMKVGALFQQKGVEVFVVPLPQGDDPDRFVRMHGIDAFQNLMLESPEYLRFYIEQKKQIRNFTSPAEKKQVVQEVISMIQGMENSIMKHESLKKAAHLLDIPFSLLEYCDMPIPSHTYRREQPVGTMQIDPDKVLEGEVLRWLLHLGTRETHFVPQACQVLHPEMFQEPVFQKIFVTYEARRQKGKSLDQISLLQCAQGEEETGWIESILEKKIDIRKLESLFLKAVQKILERDFLQKRETLRQKIFEEALNEEESLEVAKQFGELSMPSFTWQEPTEE